MLFIKPASTTHVTWDQNNTAFDLLKQPVQIEMFLSNTLCCSHQVSFTSNVTQHHLDKTLHNRFTKPSHYIPRQIDYNQEWMQTFIREIFSAAASMRFARFNCRPPNKLSHYGSYVSLYSVIVLLDVLRIRISIYKYKGLTVWGLITLIV